MHFTLINILITNKRFIKRYASLFALTLVVLLSVGIPYSDAFNYHTKGVIVRTLDLGHRPAGYYTGRSRAAYWDGRNGLGEPVASSVYFYQLQADSISHLRKMVILK